MQLKVAYVYKCGPLKARVQRGKLRSLVINFDELREPVLEYAD